MMYEQLQSEYRAAAGIPETAKRAAQQPYMGVYQIRDAMLAVLRQHSEGLDLDQCRGMVVGKSNRAIRASLASLRAHPDVRERRELRVGRQGEVMVLRAVSSAPLRTG